MTLDRLWWSGWALGTFAAIISIGGWWVILRLGVKSLGTGKDADVVAPKLSRLFSFLSVLGFLLKLPIFVACALYCHTLGPRADTGFLVGMGLVYSWLVGRAILRNKADFHAP